MFSGIAEEAKGIAQKVATEILKDETYHTSKCAQWNSEISEKVLGELKGISADKGAFKYIVSCNVIENAGSGFHSSTACFWDGQRDGNCVYRYEAATFLCIVSIFGVSL